LGGNVRPVELLESNLRKLIIFILLPLLLSACGVLDLLTNDIEHSQAVTVDLEKIIGKKPFVGFNWSNGSLTNISVTFDSIPTTKSSLEIYELAKQSIKTQFKQQPTKITISFAITQ
jgi:hypothetical protein